MNLCYFLGCQGPQHCYACGLYIWLVPQFNLFPGEAKELLSSVWQLVGTRSTSSVVVEEEEEEEEEAEEEETEEEKEEEQTMKEGRKQRRTSTTNK